jgi:hypothetical protein
MLAAKNNGSHLDITPWMQVRAVLRMLSDMDPRCSGAFQRRPAWAPNTHCNANQLINARGLALRLAPDFIMAGWAGISNMKSQAKEIAHFRNPLSLINQRLGAAPA